MYLDPSILSTTSLGYLQQGSAAMHQQQLGAWQHAQAPNLIARYAMADHCQMSANRGRHDNGGHLPMYH